MTFTQVPVRATYTRENGSPAVGTVSFTLGRPMVNGGVTVAQPFVVSLDSSGSFALPLPANDDSGTTPTGASYSVVESLVGTFGRSYTLVVPAAAAGSGITLGGIMAAAGASAGTTPPAPTVTVTIPDAAGSLTFGTGTSPATGAQVAVTLTRPLSSTPPVVVLTAGNAATAALQLYVTGVTASGFTIAAAVAPSASQTASTYAVSWAVAALGRSA